MALPPLRTELSDTYPNPSNAVMRTGMGKFWDYVTGLLGSTGNAAEARTALGISTGFVISTNHIVFPTWLGGVIFQWGSIPVIPAGGTAVITFPIAFPTAAYAYAPVAGAASGGGNVGIQGVNSTGGPGANPKTGFSVSNFSSSAATLAGAYLVIGR